MKAKQSEETAEQIRILEENNKWLKAAFEFVSYYRERISPINAVLIIRKSYQSDECYSTVDFNVPLETILTLIGHHENITIYNANTKQDAAKFNYSMAWRTDSWTGGSRYYEEFCAAKKANKRKKTLAQSENKSI